MDDTKTTIYCLWDDLLKAINHRDDPQTRLSTAEVMTTARSGRTTPSTHAWDNSRERMNELMEERE